MIRYTLACQDAHRFEAWFRSGNDCDVQLERGLCVCPVCGSQQIDKAVMAPVVSEKTRSEKSARQQPVTPLAAGDNAALDAMNARMKAMRDEMLSGAEHVGARFPEEARRMHYGEREPAGIWGEASLDEAKALSEEGIAFTPLPILPDDKN